MIRKRGKSYTVQVVYYITNKITGKKQRKYVTKSGFHTKAEAKAYEDKLNVMKQKGDLTNNNPLFTDYFKDWYTTYRIPGKAANTIKRYEYCNKVVNQYFAGVKMKSITRNSFQKFLNAYGADHAKNTVTKTVRIIEASIADAVADKLLTDNPTFRTEIVYNANKGNKVEYLSEKELHALVKEVKSDLDSRYVARYIILFAIYTGARIGEIFALSWSDIDFKHKTIHIQHSWDYTHKHIKETKNKPSNRVITASNILLAILKQLRNNDSKYVFIVPNRIPDVASISDDERLSIGLPTSDAVNHRLRYCLRKAGINKTLHVHSLRHVHVAYLYAHGVDWYSISKRLGHSSVKTTMDTYAYLIEEKKAKGDQLIGQLVDKL